MLSPDYCPLITSSKISSILLVVCVGFGDARAGPQDQCRVAAVFQRTPDDARRFQVGVRRLSQSTHPRRRNFPRYLPVLGPDDQRVDGQGPVPEGFGQNRRGVSGSVEAGVRIGAA